MKKKTIERTINRIEKEREIKLLIINNQHQQPKLSKHKIKFETIHDKSVEYQ